MTAATLHVYRAEGSEDLPGLELVVAHSEAEALAMGDHYVTVAPALGGVWTDGVCGLEPLPLPDGVTEPVVLAWGLEKWERYYYDHDWAAGDELGTLIVCECCNMGEYDSIPESEICSECDRCAGCVAEELDNECGECGE